VFALDCHPAVLSRCNNKKPEETPPMIVDLRTYTVKPGLLADYVKLYQEMGWPLQQKYLGTCLGWYTVAEGTLNTVVHMWRFDSQGDREQRRAAMAKDPAWQEFIAVSKERGYLVEQKNVFLAPTAFSPQQ
jgi:hypothetical protein